MSAKPSDGLTPMQRSFVFALIENDFNINAAVVSAGSKAATDSAKSALGSKWLKIDAVMNAIDTELKERRERMRINKDRVVYELSRIAFANMKDFVRWDSKKMVAVDSEGLTRDQTAAVSSVKQTITEHGGSIELKLHDKQKALELLGKHIGLFNDRFTLGEDTLNINVTNSVPPDWENESD